jgi:glycosyltransferase involved in cell wall biosynthesis
MDVSVIIPARNEEFLRSTIEHILPAIRADSEIIAVCDGYWPDPGIEDNDRVTLIHHTEPVGQRAAINEAARLSRAKYIIKTDGHSMFDEGFDVKLMADCEYDWTVIPRMYNLHVFDWLCPDCGDRTYQGPRPEKCSQCGKQIQMQKDEVWKIRKRRRTDYMYIDNNLRVQYYNHDNPNLNKSKDLIDDVMSGQGACFFMHRQRFLDLGGLDEIHGFWGQVGVEVACKAWLSGGRQVVNKKTWFAHMFRTKKDFGFPYKLSGRSVSYARKYSRDLWLNGKWPQQVRKFSWLVDKFAPVPTWQEEKLSMSA